MIAVTSFVRVPQGRAKTAREKMYEILHKEDRHFRETTFFTAPDGPQNRVQGPEHRLPGNRRR